MDSPVISSNSPDGAVLPYSLSGLTYKEIFMPEQSEEIIYIFLRSQIASLKSFSFLRFQFQPLQDVFDDTCILNHIDSKTLFSCIFQRRPYMIGCRSVKNQKPVMKCFGIFYFQCRVLCIEILNISFR